MTEVNRRFWLLLTLMWVGGFLMGWGLHGMVS